MNIELCIIEILYQAHPAIRKEWISFERPYIYTRAIELQQYREYVRGIPCRIRPFSETVST